jgi:virulence factor Mce-like protein
MKRGAAIIALIVIVAAVALGARTGGGSGSYRVAAIFDTANDMVAGQQVKIGGAVVGKVQEIDLDWSPAHPKARIVMSVDRRFEPFHQDATCTILPEGLISENYIQCNPGASATPLTSAADGIQTVPLRQTTIPFSLQDVLDIFSVPTDQRLAVLISELGIGTAGRGEDLSGLLQRSNPALVAAQRVLGTVDEQRRQLATAVGQSDQVLASVAAQANGVRQFVDRASTVVQTTAARSASLSASVRNLPAMLVAARPALASLDRTASNAAPLLDELHAAAPGLSRLTTTLPAFATAGLPALKALATSARHGRPAVREAVPVISHLQTATRQLDPLSRMADALLVSLRSTGGIESTMQILYTLAVLSSSYDNVSHLINFIAFAAPQCLAGEQQGHDVPGCSHKYSAAGQGTIPINDVGCGPQPPQNFWDNAYCPGAVPAGIPTPSTEPRGRRTHHGRAVQTAPATPSQTGGATTTHPSPPNALAGAVQSATGAVKQLLNQATGTQPAPSAPLNRLLGYLLR